MTEVSVGYEVLAHDGEQVLAADDERRVRLVRFRAGSGEVAALLAAAGPHVEPVLDVGTAVNGDLVLVLEEFPVGLPEVLAGRTSPGEAVTVLVPLVTTLTRLHAAGVAHGGPMGERVRFDAAGTPTLTGFGGAVLAAREGERRFERAVLEDRRSLAGVAARLLRGEALASRFEQLLGEPEALVEALFDLAEPRPVRLVPSPELSEASPPSRLLAPVAPPPEAPQPIRRPALRPALELLRRVRPRYWAAAAGSVVLLAAALVLLPGHDADASGPTPLPTRASEARRTVASPQPADPARATAALLSARQACLAAPRPGCLDAVDEAGSPLAALDAAAVAAGVDAPPAPVGTPRLRSVGGGAAVLDVGSATVLVVRERAGWRLRDLVVDRPR